jgi:tripartite-type tricarboxylate transporter receptor subunit TctC
VPAPRAAAVAVLSILLLAATPVRAETRGPILAAASPPPAPPRATALLPAQAAPPAEFPPRGRPIAIICPYAPGGVTDALARLMAAGLEKELGTPVQVVNRAGAASQIGMTELVRSRPDGATLAYAVLPTVVTHYLETGRPAPYTRENFQPIAMHVLAPMVLAVRTQAPYRSLRDLVEAARARPETIPVSTSGQLGTPHAEVLMLEYVAGVKFISVHFNGGAPSVTALLGGHVEVLAGSVADALPGVRNNDFRVVGIAAERRDPALPDVPTMREQGYDVLTASATGLVGPAGMAPETLALLSAAARRVVEAPEHQRLLQQQGINPFYLDPEAYARFWADTEARMQPVLRAIKPN